MVEHITWRVTGTVRECVVSQFTVIEANGRPPVAYVSNREDAQLMAAAPDLLAALQAVVAVLQKEAPGTALNHHQYDTLGIQAHNAIEKAEGRRG